MIVSRPGGASTRGWCPGVLDPMETGDGWLLRIRLPGGHLSPSAMRTVAAVAQRFGSGLIDLTSRANLQIRGLSAGAVTSAAGVLVERSLSSGDAGIDALRAVVASPLAGHDPWQLADTTQLVTDIVEQMAATNVGGVPAKFGIVIDDAGSWELGHVDADLRLRASATGFGVFLRGLTGSIGTVTAPIDCVLRTVRLCANHGGRMDAVVARRGLAEVAAAIGVGAAARPSDDPAANPYRSVLRVLGRSPHLDPGRTNIVAGPFLGRIDHAALAHLADLAEQHGTAVRFTTDHSIAFCGVAGGEGGALLGALGALGLLVDATDSRAAASACVGSRGCAAAHGDTWAAAQRMVDSLAASERFHLSGCSKGCGAPAGIRHLLAEPTGTFR